jgi:hypothetical protein
MRVPQAMTDKPAEPLEPLDEDDGQDIAGRYPGAANDDTDDTATDESAADTDQDWERPDPNPDDPDPALRPPQTG